MHAVQRRYDRKWCNELLGMQTPPTSTSLVLVYFSTELTSQKICTHFPWSKQLGDMFTEQWIGRGRQCKRLLMTITTPAPCVHCTCTWIFVKAHPNEPVWYFLEGSFQIRCLFLVGIVLQQLGEVKERSSIHEQLSNNTPASNMPSYVTPSNHPSPFSLPPSLLPSCYFTYPNEKISICGVRAKGRDK